MTQQRQPPVEGETVIELADDGATMTCPSCGTACILSHKYCPGCGFPMEKLREQPDDPLIGRTLPGGHVVLELIDVGGMGRVYRAEQKMLGRTVAVKIIHPHLLGDETVEARFITEARAASQLNHPNSVGVIDFGKFEGRLYMVMEYIRGRDLATVAHEEGPLALDRIVDIVTQTMAALEEAHAIGIIHRDLKPENIVLSPLRSGGDFVKVLDFGLAKVLEQSAQAARITDPGMVCGTPEYMAPEQARGENVDHRADLYACGILLYELLAGQLPFEGSSPREVVLMHLSKVAPDLRSVNPHREMSDDLVEVVAMAMAKDPAARFQSASDFARTLREVVKPPRITEIPAADEAFKACPECGAMMPVGQKFCGECGARFSDVDIVTTPGSASPTAVTEPPARPNGANADPTTDPLGHSGELPFVGREVEIAWLTERRANAGTGLTAVQVVGHAGSGKSRLLREFTLAIRQGGDEKHEPGPPPSVVVVATGPDPWWAGRGYHAVKQAIRGLADLPEDGGPAADWAGASPEVRAGLEAIFDRAATDKKAGRRSGGGRWSETPPLGRGEGNRRVVVAEALRWAMVRAHRRTLDQAESEEGSAPGARVVCTVDDLHAVDGASRNAFADVVSEPPLVPCLLVCAHRPSFDPAWEDADRLEVRGINTAVAASLLSGRIVEATDRGDERRVSPLYVDQLRRFSDEGGEDPPPKLADLLALRIERLPQAARRILQALAVLGDATTPSQLLPLVEREDALPGLLEELADAWLIRSSDASQGMFGAAHPLVRDVALAGTPAAVRATLHGRARRDLSPTSMPLEADAVHAYHAGQSFEALMLLERAADRATERDDGDGAVSALRLALDLARREMSRGQLDDPVSAVLMFSTKLGDALCLAEQHHDAEGVLVEALNLAGPMSVERSRILASLAQVARGLGDPKQAFERLEEALLIAEKTQHESLLASLERMKMRWVQGLS
ncbi:MAG: protein kinase [Myxococcota bacterium]